MHDEVFDRAHETPQQAARDNHPASSPSEAYANLSLDNPEARDADHHPRSTALAEQQLRPPPRSSSPAKRLHSEMDEGTQPPQPQARSASVDMPDVPAASSSPRSSTETLAGPSACPPPSLDEQVSTVLAIAHRPMEDGQEGFVVSNKWLQRVFSRTTEYANRKHDEFDKDALEGDIGPVDNSNLIDAALGSEGLVDRNGVKFVPLRPGLNINTDFEILPREAWDLIVGWYGVKDGSAEIRRQVHNTAVDGVGENLQYEVYPPIFTIRRVSKAGSDSASDKASPKLVASRSDRYMDFLKMAKTAAGIDITTKVQVWRVLNTAPAQPPTAPLLTPESSRKSSRAASPAAGVRASVPLAIDLASFNAMTPATERELVAGKDETANEKYNGRSTLHVMGLAEDQVLILEEMDQSGKYLGDTVPKTSSKGSSDALVASSIKKGTQSTTSSGRNSPAPSAMMTRGRSRNGRTQGTVGLTNLGNTCYMNSALQCIRSVEELSVYFLKAKHKQELNPDNPLGHGGAIAKSYAVLLGQIYTLDGFSSFPPRGFKNTLGRAQPLFSGYGQQDSQEFLSFLVDGLHEDLNRIHKKPYTENPESDDNTVHDPEAIKALGEKFREIHRARNDSVAMDLFNGFYKNTMVCPDCGKVSITFDPYSALTLQLPIEQSFQHTITFVPRHGAPIKVEIDIEKNATLKDLKMYIARRFEGVKWSRIVIGEVYTHKFYKVFEDDSKSLPEYTIGNRDVIVAYELETVPTNWPPRKKKGGNRSIMLVSSDEESADSPTAAAEKLLVPIFHRAPTSSYRAQSLALQLWPSYIVLTREEAKDSDAIMKKVLSKVAQMTTRPILSELNGSRSPGDSDIVLTTEEDASFEDPTVKAGSVTSEDNMVEVTMMDTTKVSNDNVPEVLKPHTPIPDAFRQMFTIRIVPPGKEMVPTGWSSVNANNIYANMSDRVPTTQQSSEQSGEGSTASSSDEIEDASHFSAPAENFERAGESSEEEMPTIMEPSEVTGRGGRNNKKNKRREKKNQRDRERKNPSKKFLGRSRVADQPSPAYSVSVHDDDALIRLREGIMLDWRAEAFEALFGGRSGDKEDSRGVDTMKDLDTYDDPELKAKKDRRMARKRNGITLEECFAETSKSEVLSEENAWYCSRCKELRRATKTLEIWTLPDILVIHLKRFSAHRSFRDKIEALVDCPLEGLDLTDRVGLPEGKSAVYDLFAVDNHYGGLGGGHYTACARNFFDGQWYDYNDASVSRRNPDNVVTPAAYLLFYRRRSDRPLGPPYLQKLVEQYRNLDSDAASDGEDELASGNGQRLGDSSRSGNGLSSASAGAAAGAPRAAGSDGAAAENLQLRGGAVAAVTATEDEDSTMLEAGDPPPYDDEGFGDGGENGGFSVFAPQWGFGALDKTRSEAAGDDETYGDDDNASDAVNHGSSNSADLGLDDRMHDFDDDDDAGVGLDFGDASVGAFNASPQRSSTPVQDIFLDVDMEGPAPVATAAKPGSKRD